MDYQASQAPGKQVTTRRNYEGHAPGNTLGQKNFLI